MLFYKDYFEISKDYAPCMTKEAINRDPETWLQFYPHKTFVSLLRDLLDSLNGGNKSIWLSGAYGTGKSHAALVLQKLFMDDESRVEKWLKKRETLIPDVVANALRKQRENKVLAVFETMSDGITTPEQFLVRIENSIIRALKDRGLKIPALGEADKILKRIEEEEVKFFEKRDELQDQLVNLTPNIKTVDQLRKAMADQGQASSLLSDVMTVLHARDIYISLSTENLIKWIKSILDENNYSKLIFIWDEFSSYIEQNRSQLKTFEELAEFTQEGQFFFIPVTHMKLESYLAAGSESAKRTSGRFKFCSLEMPTNTALQLAADAFTVTNADWPKERDGLWQGISSVVTNYMGAKDKDCLEPIDNFKNILPIHPMAAFVLKFLSTAVGSNQRSMFNFLKGEVGESEFRNFIEESGPEVKGRQFLTVDYLWHYFIERSDLGTGKEVTEALIEFNTKSAQLSDAEKRIFKAVLLYSLLGRLTGNAGHLLIQPTVENIKRCFEGDAEMVSVDAITKKLETAHCFSIINGRCEMFHATGSSEDLEKKKEKLRGQFNEQVVAEKMQGELQRQVKRFKNEPHYEVRASTIDKAIATCQKTKEYFGPEGNKILLQFLIAKDGQDQLRISEEASKLAHQWRDYRMLFIALPEYNFCGEKLTNWEEYVEQLAHLQLATDNSTKISYTTQINLMDREWKNKITRPEQKLMIYTPNLQENGDTYVESQKWTTLEAHCKKYLLDKFQNFLDDYSGYNTTAMALPGKGFGQWAKAGLDPATAAGATKGVWATFQKYGITGDSEWFAANSTHPLTNLRNRCKEKLDTALSNTGTCSIRKIFIELQRAPFGLLAFPYSAFVMAFAMKEWLSNPRQQLQWTNGSLSGKLDVESLAEIIDSVIKNAGLGPFKNEKLICRISKEEKSFIDAAPDIFEIKRIQGATVEGTLADIAARLEKISDKVPLWVLSDYIESQQDPQSGLIRSIIDNLCGAQRISAKGNQQERTDCIKAIGKALMETDGLAEQFARYIKREIFATAFHQFIDKQRPCLPELAKQVGDTAGQYCDVAKDELAEAASWLWTQQNVEDALDIVEAKYKIIGIIQEMIGSTAFVSYEGAIERIRHAMYVDNKIALQTLAGDYPFLPEFIKVLGSSKIADGLKNLLRFFSEQKELLKKIFLDPEHKIQIEVIRKHFSGQLSTMGDAELRTLYTQLSEGAERSDSDFKQTVVREIDEYLKESIGRQLLVIWQEKTGSESPSAWSVAHRMPATILFDEPEVADEILPVLDNPKAYQSDVLKRTMDQFEALKLADDTALPARFLSMVIPAKYATLSVDADEVSDYLLHALGDTPNNWLANIKKLQAAMEQFIRERYLQTCKSLAVDRVTAMSESDAKAYLLKIVENNPDIGLKILE